MRLDGNTFGVAQGLKAGPGLEEGVWRVCNDYKFVKPKGGDRHLIACGDRWWTVKPLEDFDLMIELARLKEQAFKLNDFEEPILGFVRKRGLLGLDRPGQWRGGPWETMQGYKAEIIRAGDVVRLYEAVLNGDESAATEVLRDFPCQVVPDVDAEAHERAERERAAPAALERSEARERRRDHLLGEADYFRAPAHRQFQIAFEVERVLDEEFGVAEPKMDSVYERLGEDGKFYRMAPLEHALVEVTMAVTQRVNELCRVTAIPPARSHDVSKVRTGWSFDSLIGAAYLQMYWLIGAEGKIKRCKWCGALIPDARADQETCDPRHKAKWNYHYGTGKSGKKARKRARRSDDN